MRCQNLWLHTMNVGGTGYNSTHNKRQAVIKSRKRGTLQSWSDIVKLSWGLMKNSSEFLPKNFIDLYSWVQYMKKTFWSSPLCSVQLLSVSDSLWSHGLQHTRLPCPLQTPKICSNSCPSSLWCHPTISSTVVPFSSCLQSFPESGSFPMRQFFASGGHNIGVSASASVVPIIVRSDFL